MLLNDWLEDLRRRSFGCPARRRFRRRTLPSTTSAVENLERRAAPNTSLNLLLGGGALLVIPDGFPFVDESELAGQRAIDQTSPDEPTRAPQWLRPLRH